MVSAGRVEPIEGRNKTLNVISAGRVEPIEGRNKTFAVDVYTRTGIVHKK